MRKNAKIEGFGAKPSILAFLLIFGSGGSNLGVRGHFLAPGPQFWGSEGTFRPSDPKFEGSRALFDLRTQLFVDFWFS